MSDTNHTASHLTPGGAPPPVPPLPASVRAVSAGPEELSLREFIGGTWRGRITVLAGSVLFFGFLCIHYLPLFAYGGALRDLVAILSSLGLSALMPVAVYLLRPYRLAAGLLLATALMFSVLVVVIGTIDHNFAVIFSLPALAHVTVSLAIAAVPGSSKALKVGPRATAAAPAGEGALGAVLGDYAEFRRTHCGQIMQLVGIFVMFLVLGQFIRSASWYGTQIYVEMLPTIAAAAAALPIGRALSERRRMLGMGPKRWLVIGALQLWFVWKISKTFSKYLFISVPLFDPETYLMLLYFLLSLGLELVAASLCTLCLPEQSLDPVSPAGSTVAAPFTAGGSAAPAAMVGHKPTSPPQLSTEQYLRSSNGRRAIAAASYAGILGVALTFLILAILRRIMETVHVHTFAVPLALVIGAITLINTAKSQRNISPSEWKKQCLVRIYFGILFGAGSWLIWLFLYLEHDLSSDPISQSPFSGFASLLLIVTGVIWGNALGAVCAHPSPGPAPATQPGQTDARTPLGKAS